MTLGFNTKIGDWETYFPEKIIESLLRDGVKIVEWGPYIGPGSKYGSYIIGSKRSKPHTIRNGHRWRAGMLIHFVTGNRTKNRLQFAPVIPAVSVQEIVIENEFYDYVVKVDGKKLSKSKIKALALNDGFDSVEQFWDYFGMKDFKGQIIHWTELRY